MINFHLSCQLSILVFKRRRIARGFYLGFLSLIATYSYSKCLSARKGEKNNTYALTDSVVALLAFDWSVIFRWHFSKLLFFLLNLIVFPTQGWRYPIVIARNACTLQCVREIKTLSTLTKHFLTQLDLHTCQVFNIKMWDIWSERASRHSVLSE